SLITPEAKQISKLEFKNNMLAHGDVESYVIVTNKNLVKVFIKKDSLQKSYYKKIFSNANALSSSPSEKGPQFQFSITKPEEFESEMHDFYEKNPTVKEVNSYPKQEGDWMAPVLNFVLPLLLIALIWLLLMRKMGGGA